MTKTILPANTPTDVHQATITMIKESLKKARERKTPFKATEAEYRGRIAALEELLSKLEGAALVTY